MATQVTNYQCPNCTGPLGFDAENGKLSCEFCASTFSVEEIEALYKDKDAAAVQNHEKEETQWNTAGLNENWGDDAGAMRVYNCPACCAELICEETTAATSCPYCGNPAIVPGQFAGVLKPDFVIPFKLKKEDAVAALKKHYERRPFLPKNFKSQNHLAEIKGVYVPFWLFDGMAEGRAAFHATKSRRYSSGDYNVTETRHFTVYREGNVSFEKIPVDGSKKMPDDYMDSLEPFDYGELTEFSTAYMPGYMADKFDVSAEESSTRADARARQTLVQCLRDTVIGYETVSEKGNQIRLQRGDVHYAMLPVWLLNTKWEGKDYLFAMNGQTGKMVGDLPIDKKKRRRVFWLTFLALSAVAIVITALSGGAL